MISRHIAFRNRRGFSEFSKRLMAGGTWALIFLSAKPSYLVAGNSPLPPGPNLSSKGAQSSDALNALIHGKWALAARYRFERYDQKSAVGTPITDSAEASTLRLAPSYTTQSFEGLSLFAEGEAVFQLGTDRYRIPTVPSQNRSTLPILLDPKTLELNQGYIQYCIDSGSMTFKVGRQEFFINNGRFISSSPWRQNHQSFDAASVASVPMENLSLLYAFLEKVHRVVGSDATDGELGMDSHLLNATFKFPNIASVTAYGVILAYDDVPVNSTKSFGLRLEGPYKLNEDWSLLFTTEFANQSSNANNPNRVNANYILDEVGVSYKNNNLKFGYTLLEGKSPTNKFQTPLAHPFNGWVEKFNQTPSIGSNDGLQLLFCMMSGPFPLVKGLTFNAIYYEYWADHGGIHYGSELDAGLEYQVLPVDSHWTVGWRFGNYQADHLFTDSLRTSLYTSYNF